MPVPCKFRTEGRGLPIPQSLEEILHDVVCEEGAHALGIRRREGRVETPVFHTPNHVLPAIVSTNDAKDPSSTLWRQIWDNPRGRSP